MNTSHQPSWVRRQAGVPHALRDGDGQRTTFFTIADVAERLQVCERNVRRWIASGPLRVHRFGRTIRIPCILCYTPFTS